MGGGGGGGGALSYSYGSGCQEEHMDICKFTQNSLRKKYDTLKQIILDVNINSKMIAVALLQITLLLNPQGTE